MSKKITGYDFEQHFRSCVAEKLGECPKQTFGIIISIDKGKPKDVCMLQFTEEVKDGRTPRFNINKPLHLKASSFNLGGIGLTINDVEYVSTSTNVHEGSEYKVYSYHIAYDLFYPTNGMSNEDIAHLTFQNHNL